MRWIDGADGGFITDIAGWKGNRGGIGFSTGAFFHTRAFTIIVVEISMQGFQWDMGPNMYLDYGSWPTAICKSRLSYHNIYVQNKK